MASANKINPLGYRLCSYRIINETSAAREAGAGAPQMYAISTETYVPQDGWVLLADGMRMHGQILPILYYHGWDESLPLGKWDRISNVNNEIHAAPMWSDSLDMDEQKKRSRAEEGLLCVSIRFNIKDWHAPDPEERAKYGIPADAPYAGIATEWSALEASFCSVPADPNAGPRSLALLHARASGIPDLQIVTPAELKILENKLDRGFAASHALIQNLTNTVSLFSQRSATPVEVGSACAPVAPKGTQNGDTDSRSRGLYSSPTLGMTLAALLTKLPGTSTGNINANPISGSAPGQNPG